jgi:hypothetical protein
MNTFFEKKIVCGASPGSAGCFKNATQIPKARHPNFFRIFRFLLILWILGIFLEFLGFFYCQEK